MDIILLYFVPILLMIMAQNNVSNAYYKYKNIRSMKGYTGEMVARLILDRNNISTVDVYVSDRGQLSDHYDPRLKRVCLSNEVYYGNSILAIAVAAHECGHALQDANNYSFLVFRNKMLPYVNITTQIGWMVLLIGFLSNSSSFISLAAFMLVFVIVFQVLTLPLELNASKRALEQLTYNAMIIEEESSDVKEMLKAAAFTYIASLVSSIAYIVRILLISSRRRNR